MPQEAIRPQASGLRPQAEARGGQEHMVVVSG